MITQLTEVNYTTFLSIEPLLESIDLVAAGAIDDHERLVSWVIVGGESGYNARPCSPEWISLIINQCKAGRIPVYVKQLGTDWAKVSGTYRKDSKGANPQLWAKELRIRKFRFVSDRLVV